MLQKCQIETRPINWNFNCFIHVWPILLNSFIASCIIFFLLRLKIPMTRQKSAKILLLLLPMMRTRRLISPPSWLSLSWRRTRRKWPPELSQESPYSGLAPGNQGIVRLGACQLSTFSNFSPYKVHTPPRQLCTLLIKSSQT